ncbi:MAG: 3-phosphoserine/phosphohydroxythreonine transaminase [Alkalispirochaeta sp.]
MARVYNFYAGPATLPLPVLEQIQKDFVDYQGAGLSLVETSHRSKEYDAVHARAMSLIRQLLQVPENYSILFLGGGATMQFGMIPMNLVSQPASGGTASIDMTLSGSWAKKALSDAKKFATVTTIFDGSDGSFTSLPAASSLRSTAGAAYFHITSNETIEGLQWKEFPRVEAPLVADMSSDIMSRPLPIEDFGLIYAGAQKNLGPAGVTVVIIRNDLLDRTPADVPAYLNYRTHAEKESLYNTPPVFSIWALSLVLEWILDQGGLGAVADRNRRKASALYEAIDGSSGYYRCPVDTAVRSDMNVVFRLPDEESEKRFIAGAAEAGMIGLKGHRSVGGVRASIYNAMPEEGVEKLVAYMRDFRS